MDTNQFSDTLSENLDDIKETVGRGSGRIVVAVLLGYLIALFVMAWYWSREPAAFTVSTRQIKASEPLANQSKPSLSGDVGVATTKTLLQIIQTLLDKNGGYIANDIFPPGLIMDNMPAWEYGALTQARDFSMVLKERIGRAPGQFREDNDLAIAESRLRFYRNSWAVPASESQYREGSEYLQAYLRRLQNEGEDNAVFLATSENLDYWLAMVEKRLDSLSQRLSASVSPRHSSNGVIKTPRLKVDDIFYEARGTTWALSHLLRAVQVDFVVELEKRNASAYLQQVIVELEETGQPMRSPIILNGSGFGVLTNHSLVMASYVSRSHAEIIELRAMLAKPVASK